ncbi:polysaccharide deacetylase family protein [Vitiosangium sp. GDMCC 1.1324]|uniref:polysaccharide deacetylase family protein n=1 Tax=Vitiosangium sp. (strain GDMCC 1.1324) TaxID=2138576 RepID=UPI000D3435FD|nr:polysaccharide deacetylase family protein [Vitiosangium sp. GDMCC 1.1324]PTL75850.1 polysaccharide deacetylase [Vitiosangium sp. GDMCC 1.1324]
MHRSFRILTALLCTSLLAPSAHAAGLKVSLTERSQWRSPLTSPQSFDVASRAEIAVFTEVLADSDASTEVEGNAASVAKWKERMHKVLVENFAKARETCATGALFCEGSVPKDWETLVATSRMGLAKLPADLAPWYAEQKPFYQGYLYELVRLAGLFPKTTSEILPLSPSERFGLELPDRSFLLTFDDGPTSPTPKGGTDAVTAMVRAEGIHAAFFLLGNNYETRRKATSVEQLRALYAGMCVGSHGQEHRSHATWAGAVAGMESFHAKLAETLPEGQSKLTLFRPPYGQRNPEILQALERAGMKNILWNIDSQDWHASTTGPKAAGRVLSLMLLWRHGTILFHDIHPKALEALPRIWRDTRGSGVSWVDCHDE